MIPLLPQHAPLVEMALDLLEPENDAECRDDIAAILYELDHFAEQDRSAKAPKTKAAKANAAQLAAALRRVQHKLKTIDDKLLSPKQISAAIKHYDSLAAAPAAPRGRSTNELNYRAAEWAEVLLGLYDQPIVTTRSSRFCRLTAVLAGRPDVDLHRCCSEFVAKRMIWKLLSSPELG